MKRFVAILLTFSWVVVPAFAETAVEKEADPAVLSKATQPEAGAFPVEGFSFNHLTGTWAVGISYGYLPGYELAVRHWLDERLALDFMIGGNYSPAPSSASTLIYTTEQWNYALGLGIRQNLARPIEDVFVQWLVQCSFYQNYYKTIDNSQTPSWITIEQTQTLNLYLGPAFEAFLPFWKSLSVEASVGLNLSSQWIQTSDTNNGFRIVPNYSYTNSWKWSANIENNGTTFSILNAAVHFYF